MRPSTYVPIQKHTLTKLGWGGVEGGGKIHIFHMNLKFNILVTLISSLLASIVLMNYIKSSCKAMQTLLILETVSHQGKKLKKVKFPLTSKSEVPKLER